MLMYNEDYVIFVVFVIGYILFLLLIFVIYFLCFCVFFFIFGFDWFILFIIRNVVLENIDVVIFIGVRLFVLEFEGVFYGEFF